ncbi:hypothetical protein [Sphingomonas sp. Leaf242]|uniref:hypothetical protein n=1 Tax=Sphingomonas sp. Leaf242 TaxID=1736304 RepID=UPI000AB2CD70|nr:hypothetical protein [Sphingomonas sp. Leaf242]
MRIEVTRRFRDMDALTDPNRTDDADPVHEVGAKLTVDKDRGTQLVDGGFAIDITPAQTPAKSAAKPRKKPTAPAPAPALAPAPAPAPAATDPASPPPVDPSAPPVTTN